MGNIVRRLSIPNPRRPQASVLIPTRSQEFQKLAVGDLVPIDSERRNAHRVGFVFVVPAEVGGVARKSQRDAPSGISMIRAAARRARATSVCGCRIFFARATGAACTPASRRASAYVRSPYSAAVPETRSTSYVSSSVANPRPRNVALALERRPVGRLSDGSRRPQDRCQTRKVCLTPHRTAARSSRPQQVPIEGFQMADVKNDAMPLRDGTIVQGFGLDDREELIGLRAGLIQPAEQRVFNRILCGKHKN